MGRHRALPAKVFLGLHQTPAKHAGPNAVGLHPGRQWVLGRTQPAGQIEATRCAWPRMERLGESSLHQLAQIAVVATNLHSSLATLVFSHGRHHRNRHRVCFGIASGDHINGGRLVVAVGIGGLVEHIKEREILPLGHGVVLVVVALRAGRGEAHPHLHGGVHPIDNRGHPMLFVVGAPLVVGHGVAMERGGQSSLGVGFRQQVPRQHVLGQGGEGGVRVQCGHQPLPPRPNGPGPIGLVALGVCVAGQVQPHRRPMFTKAFVMQHLIQCRRPLFIRWRFREGQQHLTRRRQAHHREPSASQHHASRGAWVGGETSEPCGQVLVDASPVVFRQGRPRPVRLVGRPVVDPSFQDANFLFG